MRGGVDGFEVEEDLFGVPVEEGGEVFGGVLLALSFEMEKGGGGKLGWTYQCPDQT